MALRGISTGMNRANLSKKMDGGPTVTRRAALGDIGNTKAVNVLPGQLNAKKIVKEDVKPRKPLARSNISYLPKKPTRQAVTQKCDITEEIKKLEIQESFSAKLLTIEDIDKDDEDKPQLVSELVNDIYDYLRLMESKYVIRSNYLRDSQIQPKMRTILVDWLVQVHLRFNLLQETLFLTVAIMDRYLQDTDVTRKKLQLVGVTSMFIASKYEEMYAPEIADFVYITDNAYSSREIRQMEGAILKSLDFQLGRPLPLHFLRRNSKAGEANVTIHTLAKYILELSLPEYDMIHYAPSHMAAAALCLSQKILKTATWNDTLIHYSHYAEKELEPLMQKLCTLLVNSETSKYQAVKAKYASSKFLKISCIPELSSPLVKKWAQVE